MRNVESETLKFELHKFLELIPDDPKTNKSDTAARITSILDQPSLHRAQAIYNISVILWLVRWKGLTASNHSMYSK